MRDPTGQNTKSTNLNHKLQSKFRNSKMKLDEKFETQLCKLKLHKKIFATPRSSSQVAQLFVRCCAAWQTTFSGILNHALLPTMVISLSSLLATVSSHISSSLHGFG